MTGPCRRICDGMGAYKKIVIQVIMFHPDEECSRTAGVLEPG